MNLGLFITSSFLLTVSPGPAIFFIMAQASQRGVHSGLMATLGLSAGGMVHVVAATLGLAALIQASPYVLTILKYAGAVYLFILGVKTLTQRKHQSTPSQSQEQSFWQGFIVQLLNPQVVLFFLAYLPQFITASEGSVFSQTFYLGTLFVLVAFVSDSLYIALTGLLLKLWKQKGPPNLLVRWIPGFCYLGLSLLIFL